ncbi:MAG: DUF3575 domain-containing protein [Crocinitomicaceae bacterium]|nr:DUF3575 domain-containing protein [Crocinitomicaceae bacterium]
MKTFKSLCSVCLLFITTASYAQEEIIIIDRKDYKKSREKEIKLNDNTQVVKFAPLNMLMGEINFGYERQISLKGSVDLELGPTISKVGFGIDNHFVDPFSPSVTEKSGMGFVTSVGYRYYPLDETEALNRFYVSPILKFKLENFTVEDLSGNIPTVQKGSETQFNFYFNFGYQLWVSKTFSLDFYTGMGLGSQQSTTYTAEQVFEDNQWSYQWVKQYRSGARYVFNLGLKVGIGSK